ncbi:MAG: phospholipase D family protein [Archangium sp.]
MLNREDRRLFLEMLRPDEGYLVDFAIGTTYTLDLRALLMAPLAFARLDSLQRDSKEHVDLLGTLKALRSHAEKMLVFCQGDCIVVPPSFQRLFTYVEESVVPVASPVEVGSFHPKMWAIRMINADGDVRYRVLCLSRNLTFDASWDTALVLDGTLRRDREKAFASNRPLSDFFAALPGFATVPLTREAKKQISRIADELLRVEFEFPEDVSAIEFSPIGINDSFGVPFQNDRADDRLVVSPFVTDGLLARLPGSGGTLVSRAEELVRLSPESIKLFDGVFVLNDTSDRAGVEADATDSIRADWPPPSFGLHAKVFVFDQGWDTWVWTGSANATTAAFEQNVEFQVALSGKKSRLGVEATRKSLEALLEPWSAPPDAVKPTADELKLEQLLRKVRAQLGRSEWKAKVRPDGDVFVVSLKADGPSLPDDVELSVWPASLNAAANSLPMEWGGEIVFPGCGFESLTAFFGVRLQLTVGPLSVDQEFVIRAELEGAPENRQARVLESLLEGPDAVARFIRLLLAEDALEVLAALSDGAAGAKSTGKVASAADETPLLESLLRSLSRNPDRLKSIEEVVRDLMASPTGAQRIPPQLVEVWTAVSEARVALGEES